MTDQELDDSIHRQHQVLLFWRRLSLALALIMVIGAGLAVFLMFQAGAQRVQGELALRRAEAQRQALQAAAHDQFAEQHAENLAVTAIEKLGGKVKRDGWRQGNPVVEVNLARTVVIDADLSHLLGLRHLESLDLSQTAVTDRGLEIIKGQKKLEMLYLDDTKITDRGLESLKSLKELWQLNLENTLVTDAGLANLSGVSKLKELYLGGTAITDKGIPSLKVLKQLDFLDLVDTPVTVGGRDQLREALRKAKIIHRQRGE